MANNHIFKVTCLMFNGSTEVVFYKDSGPRGAEDKALRRMSVKQVTSLVETTQEEYDKFMANKKNGNKGRPVKR